MKKLLFVFILQAVIAIQYTSFVKAQTTTSLDTTFAMKYDGISGPGYAPGGTGYNYGYGGWRSGYERLQYKGIHPKPEYDLNWGNASSTHAIDSGRTAPIMPAWEVHVRDAVVTMGHDGAYYMTGSCGDNIWAWSKGIEIWRSEDLKDWSYLGLVWDIDKEADDWVKEWREYKNNQGVRAVWAPELHYLPKHENYYICFSMCPKGIGLLKSTTGLPEGPYVSCWHDKKDSHVFGGGIDATLFEDEDGTVYMTYGSGYRIWQLNDDLSDFVGSYHEIELADPDHDPKHHASKCEGRGMNDIGHEGCTLFKWNGKYYLGATDSYYGRYSLCLAMSDNIYGPYYHRHEAIPCNGGTGFFVDRDGQLWSSYFGNDGESHFREKFGLIKAQVLDDGRIIPALDQPFVPDVRQSFWKAKWNKVWKPLQDATGIEEIHVGNREECVPIDYYDLSGKKLQHAANGIVIEKTIGADGRPQCKKIAILN